jgi:hypothetical protein
MRAAAAAAAAAAALTDRALAHQAIDQTIAQVGDTVGSSDAQPSAQRGEAESNLVHAAQLFPGL